MELANALKDRHVCRQYKDELPSKEVVEEIISAGLLASSACNYQPWEFIAVTNKEVLDKMRAATLKACDEMKISLVDIMTPLLPEGAALPKDLVFYGAPMVIALTAKPRIVDWMKFDVGLAYQNMALKAHELGIGVCPCGFSAVPNKQMSEILTLEDGTQFLMCIIMGKPADDYKPIDQPREPLEKKLRWLK